MLALCGSAGREQDWRRYEQSRTLLLAALDFIDSHNRAVAAVLDRPHGLLVAPHVRSVVTPGLAQWRRAAAREALRGRAVQGSAETETLRVPVYQVRCARVR